LLRPLTRRSGHAPTAHPRILDAWPPRDPFLPDSPDQWTSPWLDQPLLVEVKSGTTADKKRVSQFEMYLQLKRAAAKDAAPKAVPAKDAAKKG